MVARPTLERGTIAPFRFPASEDDGKFRGTDRLRQLGRLDRVHLALRLLIDAVGLAATISAQFRRWQPMASDFATTLRGPKMYVAGEAKSSPTGSRD